MTITNVIRLSVLVALLLASCATTVARNPSCAEWRTLTDEERTAVAGEQMAAGGLTEAVRLAQHVEAGTSATDLAAMAAGSITKTCDLRRWDAGLRTLDVARALYGPYVRSN
jgi:hypothetical protein